MQILVNSNKNEIKKYNLLMNNLEKIIEQLKHILKLTDSNFLQVN